MFRVQGLLPNKEICPNIARKSQKNKKKKLGMMYTDVDNVIQGPWYIAKWGNLSDSTPKIARKSEKKS